MNTELRELILKLIEKNSRLEIHDLAVMLDVREEEVFFFPSYPTSARDVWQSRFWKAGSFRGSWLHR